MRLRKLIWKLAPMLGPRAARWAWDDQFARGKWDYLRARDIKVRDLIANLASGGTVVDLGCGEGLLAFELPETSYTRYIGVDVSTVAIENALRRAFQTSNTKCTFIATDLREWEGTEEADVILIEEALYYLTPSAQHTLLDTCERSLSDRGKLVVIIHDAKKHPRTVALLKERFGDSCETPTGGSRFCFIVERASQASAKLAA